MARVAQLRQEAGGSKPLAEKLGISYQIVDRWLRGEMEVENLPVRTYEMVMGSGALPAARSAVRPLDPALARVLNEVRDILASGDTVAILSLRTHVRVLRSIALEHRRRIGDRHAQRKAARPPLL